jgi:hypothetical protein
MPDLVVQYFLLLLLAYPHPHVQAAAAARIAGKPDIFDAARSGDVKLVEDHCIADPACVHQRDL